MSLFPLASFGRRLQMVSRPRTWLARPAPSVRAQVIQRISVQVGQAPLDLGRQAELLWDVLAEVVNTRSKALLLLFPEWGAVAMVESSAPYGLSRTQLRLPSPILQWLGNQATSTARWGEMVVLPQLRDAFTQERTLFERLEAEILVPLRVDGALSAVLVLGAKTGVASEVRKAQGTEVPAGGLSRERRDRFNTPPLRRGEGDTGGEVKDLWGKAANAGKNTYQPEEKELLAGVAQAVARSLENARMHAVQRARIADLMSANEAQSNYILAISHQLKTPIAAVKASAEMLADSPVDSRAIRERLASAIVKGVDSLDRLVTELTEYGKMRHATLELHRVETDLCSLVMETCALLQPLVDEKGLRLRLDASPALPWVMADPHRVQQVLSNLLSNAIRFTPAGGEISVRVHQDGDRLLTQVTDSGPGIPEAQQKWVFEAFRGGSDTAWGAAGSGLGLAIAKALTELHGGAIWLESQEGKGTTFSFTLPLGPVQVKQR